MALDNNFYTEIFEKEIYWTDLVDKNLLNVYYLNGKNGLKDFYIKKLEKLKYEYSLTNNEMLKKILDIINNIINEIDDITIRYKRGNKININSLPKLFLVNKMNNKVDVINDNDIDRLQIKKQVLKNIRNFYSNSNRQVNDDYLYDDVMDLKKIA